MDRESSEQHSEQAATDRASLILVKARQDSAVPALAGRLRQRFPQVEVNSVADLVAHFRERLVYFRQLSYILGSEIATLRAIGVSRPTVVVQVLAEGTTLTLAGAVLGIALGLVTARYLDAILTSFPGLPAAFSFFVPRADTLTFAMVVLLVTGSVAGLYPAWLASRAPIAATLRAEAT